MPDESVVADKTYSSSTLNRVTAATNDVEFVTLPNGRHLAIAFFVSDSQANQAVREKWSPKWRRQHGTNGANRPENIGGCKPKMNHINDILTKRRDS